MYVLDIVMNLLGFGIGSRGNQKKSEDWKEEHGRSPWGRQRQRVFSFH